jgi:hypothetical protein
MLEQPANMSVPPVDMLEQPANMSVPPVELLQERAIESDSQLALPLLDNVWVQQVDTLEPLATRDRECNLVDPALVEVRTPAVLQRVAPLESTYQKD